MFSFNWHRLDSVAADAICALLTSKLRQAFSADRTCQIPLAGARESDDKSATASSATVSPRVTPPSTSRHSETSTTVASAAAASQSMHSATPSHRGNVHVSAAAKPKLRGGSGGGAASSANASTNGAPPTPPPPFIVDDIEVEELRWGQVPPFLELVSLSDALEFPVEAEHAASAQPQSSTNVSGPISAAGGGGAPLSAAHATARKSTVGVGSFAQPPPPHLPSSGRSTDTLSNGSNEAGGGTVSSGLPHDASAACHGPPATTTTTTVSNVAPDSRLPPHIVSERRVPHFGGLPVPPQSAMAANSFVSAQSHLTRLTSTPGPLGASSTFPSSTTDDTLAAYFGPRGLNAKLHLTYGGAFSLRLRCTCKFRIPVGNPQDVATGLLNVAHAYITVAFGMRFHLSHIGLDTLIHLNFHQNALRVWLEPTSVSDCASPVTKLGIVSYLGDGSPPASAATASPPPVAASTASGGGGSVGGGFGVRSVPSTNTMSVEEAAALGVFVDDRFISSLVSNELRSALDRHLVAPHYAYIPLQL